MFLSFFRGLPPLEKRFLVAIILLQLLVTTLPYAWVWTITPPGYEYSGLLYNPDDQNVHLSWSQQAAQGQFFVRDLFTTESLQSRERPLFFNALTALIGTLSRVGLPLVVAYHIIRIISAALLLLGFYALSTKLSSDHRVRMVALIFAAFASGFGFLAPLFPNRIWMDLPTGQGFPMMPEAFAFTSSYIFALNVTAMALLVAIYAIVLKANESESSGVPKKLLFGAFCAAFLLSNIHTYDAIPLIITLVLWAAISKSSLHRLSAGAAILGALLPMAYQFVVFRGSEEFRVKALIPTPAPPLLDVLLSYGFLVPLALYGGLLAWRCVNDKQRDAARLAIIWAVVTLICIYLPVSFARKMIEGLHLPLCLLASWGLVALVSRLVSSSMRRIVIAAVLAISCISSFQFIAWTLENARDNNASRAGVFMPPLYLSQGDAAALRHIRMMQQPRNSAVLCLPYLGNYVPRETGRTAYIGHWAETLHFEKKLGETVKFFGGQMNPAEARSWLQQNHIGFVVIGSYEKQLNAQLPLDLSKSKIFDENGTAIYAVP